MSLFLKNSRKVLKNNIFKINFLIKEYSNYSPTNNNYSYSKSNFKNTSFNFYNFSKKYFTLPLSFKNKINMFFKHVHPDVLGADCPPEYRKTNEKSVQEINSYLEHIDKGNKFEGKVINFYILKYNFESFNENYKI